MRSKRKQRNTITIEDVHWVMSKFRFDDYTEPLTLYLHHYREDDGGEHGSLREKYFLKRPMVDADLGCNIMPYHLPPNFPMAHHHFVYPPPMENGNMHGDASNGSTSQYAVDSDVEFPAEGVKE
uniref:Leafy cotyledon 1 n=1 Tax=Solanum tuberosum TaxID=4113 RepID=M1B1Q0_SOLTU